MKKIAIVFWSGTGNTEAMAQFIAQGAKSAGADVSIFTSGEFAPGKISEFDALALGCPAMGAEVLEELEFQPLYDSIRGELSGRRVALFGSYGWGDGEWMRVWAEDCESAGAIPVGEPLAVNGAPDGSEAECLALGAALANC